MNSQSLMFIDPPALCDEAASDVFDFLHELINAYENHYAHQLRRHYESSATPQIDLFEDLENEQPPF